MNIDLAMTILDIAGVNISVLDMDGQSFLPQLVSGDIFTSLYSRMYSINSVIFSFITALHSRRCSK